MYSLILFEKSTVFILQKCKISLLAGDFPKTTTESQTRGAEKEIESLEESDSQL